MNFDIDSVFKGERFDDFWIDALMPSNRTQCPLLLLMKRGELFHCQSKPCAIEPCLSFRPPAFAADHRLC